MNVSVWVHFLQTKIVHLKSTDDILCEGELKLLSMGPHENVDIQVVEIVVNKSGDDDDDDDD